MKRRYPRLRVRRPARPASGRWRGAARARGRRRSCACLAFSSLDPEARMTVKQQALRAIETLPEDASIEDAIDRLYLLYKIERGMAQADAGQKISHEEARERMARWLT